MIGIISCQGKYFQSWIVQKLTIYKVRSTKNRTIALDCAILITETFWILENFPWVMQTKREQNGFFPTLIVIAQPLLETTPYPLPRTGFHSFLLMPKEPKSTNSSPPCHWSQIVFWITQKVFVVEKIQRQFWKLENFSRKKGLNKKFTRRL